MIRKTVIPAAMAVVMPLTVFSGYSSASPAPAAKPLVSAAQVGDMSNSLATSAAAGLVRWAPGRTRGYSGPSFNNPTGGSRATRRNLNRIIDQVDAVQGYRVKTMRQCPRNPASFPNEINIALYSLSDGRVADALIRAHRRCISVQVLMNDHLTNGDVPAFGRLQRVLGWKRGYRSYARRCIQGCRGSRGPLHSKIYLFTQSGNARYVTTLGSSNMTGKAADVQWNDLYTVRGRKSLYDQYKLIFEEMERDRVAPAPLERNYTDGRFYTMWWPQPGHTKSTDRVLKVLKEIRCSVRPAQGYGVNGHTGVSVNIHAMEGDRGLYIAQYLVAMRRAGCNVRVLYGLIAPRIHQTLKDGGVPRRRTIFDRNGDDLTDMYTHMKVVAVNGAYLDNTASRLVYTGSENFSHKTVGADELWMRIPNPASWQLYQRHFNMIWNSDFYSDPRYAFYHQTNTPIHGRVPAGSIGVTRGDLEG